jgi:phosphoglycolate phosphatase
VVWSLDTVVNSFDAVVAAVAEALAPGGWMCDLRVVRDTVGLSLSTMFRRLAPDATAAEIEGLVHDYRRAYQRTSAAGYSTVIAGVDELLADLQRVGVPCAVTAGSAGPVVKRVLERLGISGRFTAVVTAADVNHCKSPHPAMVLAACEQCGRPPEQTLLVADTILDVRMGRRAGAATVAVTWGEEHRALLAASEPGHLVDNVDRLGEVIMRSVAPAHAVRRGGSRGAVPWQDGTAPPTGRRA